MRLAGVIASLVLASPAVAAPPEVVKREQLKPRLVEYTLKTDALAEETKVRILLPNGYDASGDRRYPVLYLLHGCCDDWRSWSDKSELIQMTEGVPLVVVMPDAGAGGFYTDWYNNGAGGPPKWETYHVSQLIPWVERTFRAVAAREGRAVAGLSMGGFGTMKYAARHPDLFVAAASFSGAVDNMDPAGQAFEAIAMQDGGRPGSLWGPRATQETRWRTHNPVDLAENLRGLRLTLRTGNGQPGGEYGGGPDLLESGVHRQSTSLHNRLRDLDIDHVWDDYGPGAHTWPYWTRALRQTLPQIMGAFAQPPPRPRGVTYTTAEPVWEVFAWRVDMGRTALEFWRLENATRDRFTLAGSGAGTVTTPPVYDARKTYRVRVGGVGESEQRPSADGRLRVKVPLGPSGRVTRRSVTIRDASLPAPVAAPRAPRTCASRRTLTIRPRVPRSTRRIAISVDGRVVRRFRGRPRTVRLSLRGLPRGSVVVRVVATLRGGRRFVDTRRYRTCVRR